MNEDKAIGIFYADEIRGDAEVANFFIEWLLDINSYKSTSSDTYFLEKQDEKIIIGNLWDETFEETLVSKEKLVNFLHEKNASLK
ncbi:MAG: hypothetical protein QM763_17015 [Agriterribacter sp.]